MSDFISTTLHKRVIIADDDDGIVDAMKIMLEMEGYEVETTSDGETIQVMKTNYPDLLLLDIWMSGMDGRTICKYLKNKQETKDIPIIMISASKDVRQDALASGADDFIAKPFERDELLYKVSKYVQK